MRLRSIFKRSIILLGFFLAVYFLLYLQASVKERRHEEPLNQVDVRQKGKAGLEMDRIRLVTQPPAEPISVSPQSLKMSDIYADLEFADKPGGVWKQGFPITYSMDQWAKRPLEVFIVPHSHHDPGWVMTLEEYFERKTKRCLDSTLSILEKQPMARFSYAEMSFFSMWINGLTEDEKTRVKRLLDTRQLEIVSGGWVMTDEATAHHYSMLDQLIEGHHWLLETFNYRPNVSWAIDPFGHSPTMSYLARKMRFSGMVLQRVHYEVKKYLAERKALEFGWHQHWDPDGHTEVLTHMMPFYSYDVPHTCGPDPSICCQFDFDRMNHHFCPWKINPQPITAENVKERATLLADQYRKKATLYHDTGVLLIPLGDDFRYLSEEEWMRQLENYRRLIEHFDANPDYRLKVRFATLSDYFDALHQRLGTRANEPHLGTRLTRFAGDMFAYADREHDYWSGYFTSRPTEKDLVRHLESELRSAELLYTYTHRILASQQRRLLLLSDFQTSVFPQLTIARRALGLFHHHDGITGTSKPHVVLNYAMKLLNAVLAARSVSSVAAAHLLLLSTTTTNDNNPQLPVPLPLRQHLRELLQHVNDSTDSQTVFSLEDVFTFHEHSRPRVINVNSDGSPSSVYVFNQLLYSRTLSTTLTLQISNLATLSVTQSVWDGSTFKETPLRVQLEPSLHLKLPSNGDVFTAVIGPVVMSPMSLTRLTVAVDGKTPVTPVIPVASKSATSESSSDIVLESDAVKLQFDQSTGFLKQFVNKRSGLSLDVRIDFLQFQTTLTGSTSGPYLFIPNGPGQVMAVPTTPNMRILRGPLRDELTVFTPYVNHTVRLYKDARFLEQLVEIENSVDLSSNDNIELVMRVRTGIASSERTFFTDSNCFQFIERRYYDKLPLQGNVYPMTCAVFVEGQSEEQAGQQFLDGQKPFVRATLLTTHAHGVTSTTVGELMVWLDRRAPKDDNRGAEAPLVGRWVTESRFQLIIETLEPNAGQTSNRVPRISLPIHRALADLLQPPRRIFVASELSRLMVPYLRLLGDVSIPCDYEMMSLKTYHSQSEAFKDLDSTKHTQIGMILHRLGPFMVSSIAEERSNASKSCGSDETGINVSKLFEPINLSKAAKMRRITMIPEPNEVLQWLPVASVDPMELDTFLLR